MEKGFTLIEVVASIAIIAMLVLAIGALNSGNIKTNKTTLNRDSSFNIAMAICEKFKSEATTVDEKTAVLYINSLNDLDGYIITDLVNSTTETPNTDIQSIRDGNSSHKLYAVVIEGFNKTIGGVNLNMLKVKVITMDKENNGVTLQVSK
ncbi:prepilin-type N-terminal cleavage/methylation domain-containing protein [Fonticella tunisiensis]|uniref:Prepilin-type N-terminal cleavage/methylation domain-containing protein n=1 Tax=Fonticella tunisiensis TaxID=1096341 RepID=A0A4R7KSZ6_9CLOT|nr:prepilin-type N-terminal cleavage/methylation domain-containing protein [Fonticella tunisiensis]TDT61965.1 prepilin-type N-terminal cleavage/methylation domain-containing protein [Fonticella tunisiensis]